MAESSLAGSAVFERADFSSSDHVVIVLCGENSAPKRIELGFQS